MTIKVTYNVTDVYMSQSVSPVYITVSYSDGGASGGGVWGSITGTLSNQTDLQNALNAKLDESTIDGGAEGQILSKASATDFDFAWINNYAKYLATNVRNQTGSTIGAFQVVYISGATGNKPLVSLADADTEATSSKTYGVTATAIANNGTGDVVTAGELSGIDTSAFNEGDLLWLSTTAGGVVTTPPAEPAHAVFIGYVVRSHPTLGTIDVAIANGYELNELHGVQITTPTDNQGLFYNATSTLWENKSITTALGYTPVPTTRNITINGVTYDLSADRTWTIATGISGSGASGQVTYWTGSSAVSGSSLFTWDNTSRILQLSGADITQIINQTNTTLASAIGFRENGSTKGYIQYVGSAFSIANRQQLLEIQGNAGLAFRTGAEAARFFSNGNLAINSTSDLGVRLGVVGDTLLRGSGNTSATTALTVQNSDGSNILRLRNDLAALFNFVGTSLTMSGVANYTILEANQAFYFRSSGTTAGRAYKIFDNTTSLTGTTGINANIQSLITFAPTSGTATYTDLSLNSTINQTGGANGITRGLYVNPTLTAAADWRSIEWSNNSGWGLYGAGTAANLLGGSLRVDGVMAQGGATAPDVNFYMRRSLSGSVFPSGIYMASVVSSTSTTGAGYFATDATTQAASFTLPNLYHYFARQTAFGAGSTVTNQYGFFVEGTLTGATNNYGFYGNIASGTGRWNLYMNGTADNYLAGSLGIGSTALTGKTLVISKNITGSTIPDAVQNNGVIQSDVTNATNYFITGASTAAAAFTLPTLRHYIAVQGTFGAGSSVTNQYGYFAHGSMVGATNNYGFYGDIAGGTGRWNLYMAGTAFNYMNGSLGIGTATIERKLHVVGDVLVAGVSGGIYFKDNTNTPFLWVQDAYGLRFGTNNTERMRLDASGNLGIGITPTARLHVSGDSILVGSGATSATTALTVQNSSSTNLFTVRNDGYILQKRDFNGTTDFEISNTSTLASAQSRLILTSASGTIIFGKNNSNYLAYKIVQPTDAYFYNYTAGDISLLNDFATGQIKFAAGGASTAHLTIKSNGRINMSSLPTSSTGLVAGDLWNDAGTVKIV